ncbi:MAG: hypothetical protein DRI57_24675 [Deltaproteobacteria bacterium]|nr:MAG: hypothetical protein DRI57_24675 [Deltaproteobacteria bacterium]
MDRCPERRNKNCCRNQELLCPICCFRVSCGIGGYRTALKNELAERGVPKENIVLAFHEPCRRRYSGFAVN